MTLKPGNSLPEGIIFDFDGVVVDSEHEKINDLKKLLSKHNYSFKTMNLEKFMGKKTSLIIKENFPNISDRLIKEVVSEKRALEYKRIREYKLIKGIKNILLYLKDNDFKIGIATGSRRMLVKNILQHNNILEHIDFFVTGEDFDFSKPNPECFKIMLEKMKLDNNQVIVIEDSIAGIKAAKANGMKVFGLTTYFGKSQLSESDKQFNNHLEIIDYLKKQNV